MAAGAQTILYETLAPLGGGAIDASVDVPSPETESYFVLRNEISASTVGCPSSESAAPDYFSLELDEGIAKESNGPATRVAPSAEKGDSSLLEWKSLEGSWFHSNGRIKSPMLRLHKEILDFSDFLSPTPEEQQRRNTAIEAVFGVIRYIWPYSQVEVFGSFKTGLYLPSSDIDIVILGSDVSTPSIGLQALSRALSCSGMAKKIQVISKARVPIIKFVEKKSGFAFDISFDVSNGPKSAEFIKHVMAKWPPLKPLCLILKVFLQQRELNEVYTGGIGSYALLSMLIAMLRTQKDHHGLPEYNLGVLLVNFFEMYGCKLNTADVGVSCNGDLVFYQKHRKGSSGGGRGAGISIEDPQAPDNDIGKNSFNYYQVRSAFAMAYTTLTNTKTIARLGPDRSILGAIIRPDAVLLERKGGSNGRKTFDNVLPGAGEPLQLMDDNQEMYYNWALHNDENDEPLPRGSEFCKDGDKKSPGKKRKKGLNENGKTKKKVKENGSPRSRIHKNGSNWRNRFK